LGGADQLEKCSSVVFQGFVKQCARIGWSSGLFHITSPSIDIKKMGPTAGSLAPIFYF